MKTKRSARANTFRHMNDVLFDIMTYTLAVCAVLASAAIAVGFFFLWDMALPGEGGLMSFFKVVGMILVFKLALRPICDFVVVPIGDRIGNFMDRFFAGLAT